VSCSVHLYPSQGCRELRLTVLKFIKAQDYSGYLIEINQKIKIIIIIPERTYFK